MIPKIFQQKLFPNQQFDSSHPLYEIISENFLERLAFIKKTFFNVLFLGGDFALIRKLPAEFQITHIQNPTIEALHGLKDQQFDLCIDVLNIQTINDVPGYLALILQTLKKDGLLMGLFFGEETLYEFRQILETLELEYQNGAGVRMHPNISTKDTGYLLQRAGFNLPVADKDHFQIEYQELAQLKKDIHMVGLQNQLAEKAPNLSKATFTALKNQFPMLISFDVVYFQGWRPDASQQKPLSRGAGKISLIDVFENTPSTN